MRTMTETGLETLTVFVPRNMNLDELPAPRIYKKKSNSYEEDAKFIQRHQHKIMFLISNIILKHIRMKKKFDAAVTLDSQVLKRLYGDRYYKLILDILINAGWLTKVSGYSAGYKSTSYRISKALIEDGFYIDQITNRTLCYKISMFSSKQLQTILDQDDNAHLFFSLTTLEIDIEAAKADIEKRKISRLKKDTRIASLHLFAAMSKAKTQSNLSEGNIKLDFPFTRCRGGRIHCPASQLPSDLLPFIKDINVEMDCTSSQLNFGHDFMLRFVADVFNSDALKKCHYIGEGIPSRNSKEKAEQFFKNEVVEGTVDEDKSSPYVVTISNQENKPNLSDLLKVDVNWVQAITKGYAYEYLMQEFDYKGTRSDFKEQFFKNIFYNAYRKKLTKMETQFRKVCPNEFRRIRYVKSILGNREMAVLITRHESRFWVATVNKIMKEQFPDCKYLNRHDAILIHEDDAAEIYPVIEAAYHDYLTGRKAKISIKRIPNG